MHFFHSFWKNLHQTENFFTDMSVVSVTNMRYDFGYDSDLKLLFFGGKNTRPKVIFRSVSLAGIKSGNALKIYFQRQTKFFNFHLGHPNRRLSYIIGDAG